MALNPLDIIKPVVMICGQPTFQASKNWAVYVRKYEKNLKELEACRHQLMIKKKDTEELVEVGNRKNEVVVAEVKEWLEEVDQLIYSKDKVWIELLDKNARKKAEQCCFGFCWSPKYRHDVSKKAVEMCTDINDKIDAMNKRGQAAVTLPQKRSLGEIRSTHFCEGLVSRLELLEDILRDLKDDKIIRIGVYGPEGSGKTTLMSELIMRAQHENLFDGIVKADIPRPVDPRAIQDEIADCIQLSLGEYKSIHVRAQYLSHRLTRILNENKPKDNKQQGPRMDDQPAEKGKKEPQKLKNEKDGLLNIAIAEDNKDSGASPDKKKDSGASSKLLLIFDNVWENLDLGRLGISRDLENDWRCKIIVVSNSKHICEAMGASSSIYKLDDLSDPEAEYLFKERVGNIVQDDAHKDISKQLLNKCPKLPLTICGLADTLKNQSLLVWQRALRSLDNPFRGENIIQGDRYQIIEMIYKTLGDEGKKEFFLLCCLFPPGSGIYIYIVLKYGIGLGVFRYTNSLVEALNQAYEWIDELKSVSLFTEFDAKKGKIDIANDVRKAGKSLSEKHVFHVGSLPKWLDQESYEKFTAISVGVDNGYEHLQHRDLSKLQILRCPSLCGSKVGPKYLEFMKNLKVLDLFKSDISSELLSSIGELEHLKTLLLDCCTSLKDKDISKICELKKLQALSLRKSDITKLPEQIGHLVQLKLLDLSNSNELKEIPGNTLVKLTRLEGLYLRNSFCGWEEDKKDGGRMASLSELNSLPLNAIEIKVKFSKQLCDEDFPLLDLSSYTIQSAVSVPSEKAGIFSPTQDLQVGHLHARALLKKGWKSLVSKAENLYLENIQDLENVAPYLSDEYGGLNDLKRMTISKCTGMQYLINTKGMVYHQMTHFPKLEILCLDSIYDMKTICYGKCPPDLFTDLQDLRLSYLYELRKYALPFQPSTAKLRDLDVFRCSNLKYIYYVPTAAPLQSWGNEDTKESSSEYFELPHLRRLHMRRCSELKGLCNRGKYLFWKKMRLPSLEKLKARSLYKIEELWDFTTEKDFSTVFPELRSIKLKFLFGLQHIWNDELCNGSFSFENLKKLKVLACDALKTIFPLAIAMGLHQLELLRIDWSDEVHQIIATNNRVIDEDDNIPNEVVKFPKLLTLDLMRLRELTCFYKGCRRKEDGLLFNTEVEFPMLQQLLLKRLPKINKLWVPKTAEKFTRVFPNLKTLSLEDMSSLKHVWSKELCKKSHNFVNFDKITVESCGSLKSFYKPLTTITNKTVSVKFSALQTLTLRYLRSFKYLMKGNVNLEFSVLKNLELINLSKMNTFASVTKSKGQILDSEEKRDGAVVPLFHPEILFPALEVLELKKLPRVDQLWSVTTLEKSPNLQCATTTHMPNIRHHSNEGTAYFESIVEVKIESCENLKCLFLYKETTSPLQLQSPKMISFPKLARLELVGLNDLRSIFLGIINMEFETLKYLVVKKLPMIKTLVRRRSNVAEPNDEESTKEEDDLDTEKPTRESDDLDESIWEDDGLFHIEESIEEEEDEDPDKEYSTEEYDFPDIEESTDGDDQSDKEEHYSSDVMAKLNEDQDMALFNGNVEFPSLEELTIEDVPQLEHIYNTEDNQNALVGNSLFPRLENLYLTDLSKLKQLPNHMSRKLSSVQVSGLPRVRYLLSLSNVYEWEKLKQLTVKNCDDMEAIVAKGKTQGRDFEFVFPKLEKIKLFRMLSLDSFCTASSAAKLHSLNLLEIRDCEIMRSFSSTSPETPNLSKVEVDMETIPLATHHDLNIVLQHKFDSKHKYAKYWPREIKHKLHKEHELRLAIAKTNYICKGCGEEGKDYTYRCGRCDFNLHPLCALEEFKITEDPKELEILRSWPRKLKQSLLHVKHEELTLFMGRKYKCHGCGKEDELFSYCCFKCNLDWHPNCARVVSPKSKEVTDVESSSTADRPEAERHNHGADPVFRGGGWME